MISGASSYRPSAQGPTPSPPKPSQSLAPTGWTPSASAVSASDQPSATTRTGSSSTVTSPNAVPTVTGKTPDDVSGTESSSAPVPQPAVSRAATARTVALRARMGAPSVSQVRLTYTHQ